MICCTLKKHFFLIKNFQHLLGLQRGHKYYCKSCLNGFIRPQTLTNHTKLCGDFTPQRTAIPREKISKFKDLSKMFYHPFCVYADFECMTQKISHALPSSSHSYTEAVEQHFPISYSIIVINSDDEIIFHEFFCGLNAVEQFLKTLKQLSEKLISKMKNIVEIDPNLPSDYNPNTCHICNTHFMPNEIKTKDHSHWGDGQIRGLAHQHCNLNYRATYFMPVIIHNSKNYDAHLILERLPR